MEQHEIVVYTQPGCSACQQEKEFLSRRGVEFTEKNIRADLDAMQDMVRMGSQATPTTVYDGEVIVGFDQRRISEKLGI